MSLPIRAPGDARPVKGPSESMVHLPNLWRAIWRGRAWIIATPLVLVLLVALWTRAQEREYDATATLLVETEGADGGMLARQVAAFAGLGTGRSTIETDLALLESRQIAEMVADSLRLQVVVRQPDMPRGAILTTVEAERDAFAGTVWLSPVGNGSYRVSVDVDEASERRGFPVPESVREGEPLEFGGVRVVVAPSGPADEGEVIELRVLSFRSAVERLMKNLEVTRDGASTVVGVRARYTDPEIAAAIANGVVARFVEYRRLTSRDQARGSIDFLREQASEYETQLRSAEDELRAYREQELVVSPEAAATQQAQRLGALEAERADLLAERQVLGGMLDDVRAAGATNGTSEYRRLATFPEFFRNPAVQNILSALVDIENQRSELLVRRTGENVDVRGLTERIEELEEQLLHTATNYLARLDEQIAAIDRTLAGSAGQASRVPGVQTEFLRLSRRVELLEEIYALLEMRLKEQEVAEADARSDVRLVDAALVPLRQSSPRPLLNVLLAMLVGGMLGVGIAVARAVFDPAMYSSEVVAAAAGGVSVLGSIPDARTAGKAARLSGGARLLRRSPVATASAPGGLVAGEMDDPAAEAYTLLRTRLSMLTVPAPRVIAVTSPLTGDGKSTVAANLALAYALRGARTLLVEGDLRRGGLVARLGLSPIGRGLGEVLQGQVNPTDAIRSHRTAQDGVAFDVLPAGVRPRHPAEILDSKALPVLLDELRQRYEVVIIDTPPVAGVADALLIARHSDGALLVTRAGATDRGALEESIAQLEAADARVLGLVLNGFRDGPAVRYAYGR